MPLLVATSAHGFARLLLRSSIDGTLTKLRLGWQRRLMLAATSTQLWRILSEAAIVAGLCEEVPYQRDQTTVVLNARRSHIRRIAVAKSLAVQRPSERLQSLRNVCT